VGHRRRRHLRQRQRRGQRASRVVVGLVDVHRPSARELRDHEPLPEPPVQRLVGSLGRRQDQDLLDMGPLLRSAVPQHGPVRAEPGHRQLQVRSRRRFHLHAGGSVPGRVRGFLPAGRSEHEDASPTRSQSASRGSWLRNGRRE
jgi:hypothetical protein